MPATNEVFNHMDSVDLVKLKEVLKWNQSSVPEV